MVYYQLIITISLKMGSKSSKTAPKPSHPQEDNSLDRWTFMFESSDTQYDITINFDEEGESDEDTEQSSQDDDDPNDRFVRRINDVFYLDNPLTGCKKFAGEDFTENCEECGEDYLSHPESVIYA